MRRLFEPGAYAADPGSYWAKTVPPQVWPRLDAPLSVDVAVIGGGFTGLNAALTLAQSGAQVAVFEAERPGWGASGRNGGFCCLGGALLTKATLARQHGAEEATLWDAAEKASVAHVARLLSDHAIGADTHSNGETLLAHSARAWRRLQDEAQTEDAEARLLPPDQLTAEGLDGPWFGGLTRPVGFALNPLKYHVGLSQAAQDAGALVFASSPVTRLTRASAWQLTVNRQSVTADRVVLATNGYSCEDLPEWLRARTLPVQSSVIVTRVLTEAERQAAGWWSDQMAYDTRNLLHYFRRLPDGRFLFGMRGGLTARPLEQRAVARRIRRDFARLFPAWKDVEIAHDWSGLVCLLSSGVPFVGPVPDAPGLLAALGFHGNGVAMGSYAGHLVAGQITGVGADGPSPAFLRQPPGRFPFGRYRRGLLRPAYLLADLFDL